MSFFCEPCSSLSKDNPATHKCNACEELYCEKCSVDHTKFRAFRKHTVIELEQEEPTQPVYENISLETDQKQADPGETSDQNKPREGDYENVTLSLQTGVKQLDLDGKEKGRNAPHSASDDLEAGKTVIYTGSDDVEADKQIIYAGSDDLEADKQIVYAGSDDLEADKQIVYTGSDEREADKKIIYAGSDDPEADKQIIYIGSDELEDEPEYSTVDDDDQPVNHFYIDVEDTPLSRAIGVQGQRCLLIVNKDIPSVSVSQDGKKKLDCNLKVVRRYGHKPTMRFFTFEFGRGCQYGSGFLNFNIEGGPALLMSRLREAVILHTGKKEEKYVSTRL